MNKIIALCVVGAGVAGFFGGYKWASVEFEQYKQRSLESYSKLLEEKIELDNANRKRIDQIEKDNLNELAKQKAKYEKVINNIYTDFKPSGVRECPGTGQSVSGTAGDSGELVCYTRSELQRKIAGTMAVGRDADELAVKYNSLLQITK